MMTDLSDFDRAAPWAWNRSRSARVSPPTLKAPTWRKPRRESPSQNGFCFDPQKVNMGRPRYLHREKVGLRSIPSRQEGAESLASWGPCAWSPRVKKRHASDGHFSTLETPCGNCSFTLGGVRSLSMPAARIWV